MKIKIFSIAVDGPKCGTVTGACSTKGDAYIQLLDALGLDGESEADMILGTGDFDRLEDYLSQQIDSSTSWSIGEREIDLSIVGELVQTLEALDQMLFFALRDGFEPGYAKEMQKQARASISKAKGETSKTTP